MFVFHKEPFDYIKPPEYYIIEAETHKKAAVKVLRKNKFIEGNYYLLKFIKKRFTNILDAIPPEEPAFYKLEEQNNLQPFEASWWEKSDALVSLVEIFDLAIKYNSVKTEDILKAVLKPTDAWEFRLFMANY